MQKDRAGRNKRVAATCPVIVSHGAVLRAGWTALRFFWRVMVINIHNFGYL